MVQKGFVVEGSAIIWTKINKSALKSRVTEISEDLE